MWTPEQLASRGLTKREVERHRQQATRVRHGIYTDATEDQWELYRLRCIAVAQCLTGAVLAGPSAAAMWGLHAVGDPPECVYVRGVCRGRYGKDVRLIGGGQAITQTRQGVQVTSAAWAVVDCARVLSHRDALIAADSALHQGLCDVGQLQAAVASLGRSKRVARARWVVQNANAKSESPGETWLRMIVKELGYEVTSQVWVKGPGVSARVDLMINGQRIALEFDGLIKYNGEDEELAEVRIKQEKRRQGDLEMLGYQVLRFIWEQLFDAEGIRKRLAYAVARAEQAS